MDARVATEVMGWTALRKPGLPHLWIPPEHFISGWRPSKDILAAEQVLEKLAEDWHISIDIDSSGVEVQLKWALGTIIARAKKLPLAICRAALMVVEKD